MTTPIERNEGITPTEQYLKKLCDKTFLSLWSYPGVFRNQGNHNDGDGKEVCDLLVVFGQHILIFSDKECEFPNSGNIVIDWNRWFKRAIQKSAKQLWGAERWIRSFPDRIFLDRKCTQPFPIELPDIESAIFHLVVIAHDSSKRCQQLFGGSGSLLLRSSTQGGDHYLDADSEQIPFIVGDLNPNKSFVHILDDNSLDIVLDTLDTISDFTTYLTKKEAVFRSAVSVMAAGEEDLLAFYLREIDDAGEHYFSVPEGSNAIYIDEGHWQDFLESAERKAQIKANKISYLWDALIETFSMHALAGTHYYASHPGVASSETIYRFLARESRTRRRMLARSLAKLIEGTPIDVKASRVMLPSSDGDPFYVFLLLPKLDSVSETDYRDGRRQLLEAYCMVTKLRFPNALDIVGIATETGANQYRSEDAIYFDARQWTENDKIEAQSLQQDLGLLTNTQMFEATEYEYPPEHSIEGRSAVVSYRKRNSKLRNKPCPCGSGKKFKYCHGRQGWIT